MGEKDKQTLSSLTQNFVDLISNSEETEFELGRAAELLHASKRRLYDVTNVLQGVGFIERCGRSKVKRADRSSEADQKKVHDSLVEKKANLEQLNMMMDRYLDELIKSDIFLNHGWVTNEDVMPLIPEGGKMFALRGPADLEIQIRESSDGLSHSMYCESKNERISFTPIGRKN